MPNENKIFKSFLGYKPDVAYPPFNSAKAGKNFSIHRHRDPETNNVAGWIELAQGYAKKYTDLPADSAIKKVSNIAYENIHNFYVPENGGQVITVVTATYRKTGFFTGNPTLDRFGIFIRPWWNGAAWVDEWRELTEMFIFHLVELGTAGNNRKLYIDNAAGTTYGFSALDPGATVFNASYFKDWTIVYNAFGDSENYDLVADCGYDGVQYRLTLLPGHTNTDFSTRVVGTKLLVYRGFLMQELPSSLSSHIYGLLSGARITTGNGASDVMLMCGYKSFSHAIGGANAYTRTVNEVLCDVGVLNVWKYAAMVGIAGAYAATGADVIAPGTYYFKKSIVFDDGNETSLENCVTADAGGLWTAGNSVVVAADQKIGIYVYRSAGALPRRARYLRLHMSNDNVRFYRVKDYDLRDATLWNQSGLYGFNVLGGNHWFSAGPSAGGVTLDSPTTMFIVGTDWSNAGALAETQIGRAMTDTGVVQFKHAAVVGKKTFAVGVRAGGILYPNHAFATPANGDGGTQYDVFALVSTLNIDLEYNDGDELKAVESLGDRILFWKSRSLILVTAAGGTFFREVITKADGICSFRTIANFEDVVYYAGYNGIYEFSTRGWRLINEDWLLEWKAVAQSDKEAAIATFDTVNRQYRIAYAGIDRAYHVDTKEWTPGDLTDQPARFAQSPRTGTVDYLSGAFIQTLGAGTRHDGANFTMEYEFNVMEATPNVGVNALFKAVKMRYVSSVNLTVQLYADGVAVGSAATLSKDDTEAIVKAPLSTRCKRYHLKVTAVTTAADQTVVIKEVNPVHEVIASGVSKTI